MWGRGLKGNNPTCSALSRLLVTSPATHKQIGPFWCWFPGGCVCIHSRTLWVSPANSPMKLGVSPATAIPKGFLSQRFWDFLFLHLNPRLCGLSWYPDVPPGLSACKGGTAWSASHCLTACPCPLSCPSPSLPVWINVSSLTPWLSEFHTVQFSVSSGYYYYFLICCPFFVCVKRQSISIYASILAGSLICLFSKGRERIA